MPLTTKILVSFPSIQQNIPVPYSSSAVDYGRADIFLTRRGICNDEEHPSEISSFGYE